ncbi:MAG: DUF3300 domain-containing protein, partial [Candidatus Sulfotelmatobacter sp.]
MQSSPRTDKLRNNKFIASLLAASLFIACSATALAQEPNQAPPPDQASDQAPPPSYSPDQLDKLVSRVALYPDPLLAQVLAAATYSDQIPD